MKLNDREILFASLVGSRLIKEIPNFRQLENHFNTKVLPTTPKPLLSQKTNVQNIDADKLVNKIWEASPKQDESNQYFPLKMSVDGFNWFLLPYEPIVNISGSNEIVKTDVKANPKKSALGFLEMTIPRGTIKERIHPNDYSISITGVLMGDVMDGKFEDSFPRDDFQKLKFILENSKEIFVNHPLLEQLDIHKIVIESFDFPFSKGENVQAYSIKALSDDYYELKI